MSERAYTDKEAERHFWMESDDPMAGRKLNATLVGHKLLRLQDENAALKVQHAAWTDAFGTTQLTHALAERDALRAKVERMEKALHKLARLGNGDRLGNSEGNVIAQEALNAAEGK